MKRNSGGLMWKLLRKNISAGQLTGFSIANLIGLTIVILAVQFYGDVKPLFNDEESFISRDYLVITHKVTGMGALLGANATFSDDAIADIEAQPWVRKVGRFTTSAYSVYASVGLGGDGRSLSSKMFFESIPSEFIDVEADDWHFSPSHPVVPVIVSKDYLSLYNFGFAAAQGMPKISEGMIGMIDRSAPSVNVSVQGQSKDFDYEKFGRATVDAMIAAGIGFKCDDREFARLIKDLIDYV